ncbi:MAG: hypothetical protein ACOYLQ_09370 [Hyphomicrobiaceae bacterium]
MRAGLAASLLIVSGCSKDSVVVEVVALPPVADQLKTPVKAPLCLDPRRKDYSVEELEQANVCWRQAFGTAAARHQKLAMAVEARERAAAQAVAAAKP